jgi:hypothetical protein
LIKSSEFSVSLVIEDNLNDLKPQITLNSGSASTTSEERINRANLRRLELDSPDLAAEGVWCHPTSRPEKGGLLVASNKVSEGKGSDKYEEVGHRELEALPYTRLAETTVLPSNIHLALISTCLVDLIQTK